MLSVTSDSPLSGTAQEDISLHPRRTRFAHAALSVPLILLLAGCSGNPFRPSKKDYGDLPKRVRSITPLELEAAPRKSESEEVTADSMRDRPSIFEGLEEYELDLQTARAVALQNNLDLRVEMVNPAIADENVGIEEGRFDSAFTLTGSFTDTDSPTFNTTQSSRGEFTRIEPGVRVPLLSGGQAEVTLPINRSDTTNPFNTSNRAWETDLAFSFSQPLLRNAGRRATTTALRIASYNRAISETRVRLQVTNTLAAIDRAYWRLYQARKVLEIEQTQFESARELLARAERLFDAGTVPEIEVIRAQSGVATRLDGIIRAERNVLRLQRELKRVMNAEGLDVSSQTILSLQSEPDPVEYEFDAAALAETAVRARSEMMELEIRLAIDETQIEFDKNQRRPLFNFFAEYRINGLDNEASGAFNSIVDNPYQDEWTLGANVEIPFENLVGESRHRRSLLTRLQRIATKAAREQTIRQEVFDAIDELRASWQSLLAARQSVATTARALAAERRQFEVGLSTSQDVLDAVARLAAEQALEIAAIVNYQIAQNDLAVATGTALGAGRVDFAVPESEELLADDVRSVREDS